MIKNKMSVRDNKSEIFRDFLTSWISTTTNKKRKTKI